MGFFYCYTSSKNCQSNAGLIGASWRSRRDRVWCVVSSGRGRRRESVDGRGVCPFIGAVCAQATLAAIVCDMSWWRADVTWDVTRSPPGDRRETCSSWADHLAPWSQLGGPVRSYVADCRLCEAASRVPRHGPRHEHEPNVRSPLSANGHPRSHASALSAARRARIIPPRIAPRASSGRAALSE